MRNSYYSENSVIDLCDAEADCTYKLRKSRRVVEKSRNGKLIESIPLVLGEGATVKDLALVRVEGQRNRRVRVTTSIPQTRPLPILCHSTSGGMGFEDLGDYLRRHTGSLHVYRLKDDTSDGGRSQEVAIRAGAIAATWAASQLGGVTPDSTLYSTVNAGFAAFSSSHYGSKAKALAAKLHEEKGRSGGPLAGTNKKMEWFCSMFVIGAYHAAAYLDENERSALQTTNAHRDIEKYLPLDAQRTTPMLLDAYLRVSKAWQPVGYHKIT